MSSSNHVLLNDSYQVSLMQEIKFELNYTLLENKVFNMTLPTISQFNKSNDLESLDSNHNNKVLSFV